MNQTFDNPYKVPYQSFNGEDKNLYRAPASIGKADYEFIRGIRPSTGTVNTTQNLLWSKLVTALKKHGITSITNQSEFESFVANCLVTDGRDGVQRSSVGRNGKQTVVGNVGAGTPRARRKNPKLANSKSDSPSGDDKGDDTGGK
jgi:hypothetical protein